MIFGSCRSLWFFSTFHVLYPVLHYFSSISRPVRSPVSRFFAQAISKCAKRVMSSATLWAFYLLSWTNCNSCKDCFPSWLLAPNKRTALFGWYSLFRSQGGSSFPIVIYHLQGHLFWMSRWINVFKHCTCIYFYKVRNYIAAYPSHWDTLVSSSLFMILLL